jgi:hypothetical protein
MHLPADSSIVLLRGTGFRCFSPHMSLSHHSAAYLGTRLHGRTPACTNSCKPLPSPALPYYQLPYQLTSLPPFSSTVWKHALLFATCSAVFPCVMVSLPTVRSTTTNGAESGRFYRISTAGVCNAQAAYTPQGLCLMLSPRIQVGLR